MQSATTEPMIQPIEPALGSHLGEALGGPQRCAGNGDGGPAKDCRISGDAPRMPSNPASMAHALGGETQMNLQPIVGPDALDRTPQGCEAGLFEPGAEALRDGRVVFALGSADARFCTLEVSRGDDAKALIDNNGENIALLFTDVHMPGSTDGFALARYVAERWPEIEIVRKWTGEPRAARSAR